MQDSRSDRLHSPGRLLTLLGIAWNLVVAAVTISHDPDAAVPLVHLVVTVPGAAVIWAIGRFGMESRYSAWEALGPLLPTTTYLTCVLILGGENKSGVNGLDDPTSATFMYLLLFLLRSFVPPMNRVFGRAFAVTVFVTTIFIDVSVFLTTGPAHL